MMMVYVFLGTVGLKGAETPVLRAGSRSSKREDEALVKILFWS